MASIFEKDMVTIPQHRYEKLVKTETKYEMMCSILATKTESIFQQLFQNLKEIDIDMYNEMSKKYKIDETTPKTILDEGETNE